MYNGGCAALLLFVWGALPQKSAIGLSWLFFSARALVRAGFSPPNVHTLFCLPRATARGILFIEQTLFCRPRATARGLLTSERILLCRVNPPASSGNVHKMHIPQHTPALDGWVGLVVSIIEWIGNCLSLGGVASLSAAHAAAPQSIFVAANNGSNSVSGAGSGGLPLALPNHS